MSNEFGAGAVLVTVQGSGGLKDELHAVLSAACDSPPSRVNGVWVGTWGLDRGEPTETSPLLLTSTNQSDSGTVPGTVIARWLADGDLLRLGRMLPPFGAVGLTAGGLRLATDQLAFRNMFRCAGEGWEAVSTSALLLARMAGRGLSPTGLRLQSQLGWQLGTSTMFEGVTTLAPGEALVLGPTGTRSEWIPHPRARGTLPLDEGVELVAHGLREMVTTYLDEGHEPTLQLTGGQDSRIVLSAIPAGRRRGLRTMTLGVPGSPDVAIARDISQHYGMHHTVHSIDGLQPPSPEEWFQRVLRAARSHDCMADPVARSVTGWAEEAFEQGHRLSGLGGEFARGFYYLGRVRPALVTRRRSEQLARWRMLANDAVELEALARDHRDARETAVDLVHEALEGADPEWFRATDELYLHRIRRWGGLGEGAVAFRRTLVNPMLDHRFIEPVSRISPAAKKGASFLGRLQMALDTDLAAMPLDDRPSPATYGTPGALNFLRTRGTRLHKLSRKVRQRLQGARRPPAGASMVTAAVRSHIHASPEVLVPARESRVFDDRWLDGVADGSGEVSAAALALLVNVIAAGREEVLQ